MRHGTLTGYRNGCRCDGCGATQAEYQQQYRPRHRAARRAHEAKPDVRASLRGQWREREKRRPKRDLREYKKRYRAENRDRLITQGDDYRAVNRASLNAKSREYARAHPEVVSANSSARRARIRHAPGRFAAAEFKEKCVLLGNVCFYCGEAKPLTADHKIPLSRGGSNDIFNILPACAPCNFSKKDKTAQEYIALRQRRWEASRAGASCDVI